MAYAWRAENKPPLAERHREPLEYPARMLFDTRQVVRCFRSDGTAGADKVQ